MSFRRLNLLSSLPSMNSNPDSPRSTRPPTYNSLDTPESPAHANSVRSHVTASADVPDENASLPSISIMSRRESMILPDETGPTLRRRQTLYFGPQPPAAIVRYLYYRVYTENGEMASRHPVNSKDPSLTRVRALAVAPPHTVASIKRCLCTIEHIGNYDGAKIFETLSSETPMEEGHVSLMAHDGPGATSESPMVLVRPPLDQVVRVKHAWTPANTNSKFLTIKRGETLHTDGIIKSKTYSGRQQEVYKALNSEGSRGYVLTSCVEFDQTHSI